MPKTMALIAARVAATAVGEVIIALTRRCAEQEQPCLLRDALMALRLPPGPGLSTRPGLEGHPGWQAIW
jgi:hypothetical protein